MRKLLAAVALTVSALTIAAPAGAGGWAVTTLDPLGAAPVAGQPFDVGFTIRQHGQTPISVTDAAIIVTDPAGVETRFAAEPVGAPGHHVAAVELAAAGAHTWSVDQGLGVQDLGTLHVGPAGRSGGAAGSSPWAVPSFVVAALLAGLGVVDLARGPRAGRRRPVAA